MGHHAAVGFFDGELGNHLWLSFVEKLKIFFFQRPDRVALRPHHHRNHDQFTLELNVDGASCEAISGDLSTAA